MKATALISHAEDPLPVPKNSVEGLGCAVVMCNPPSNDRIEVEGGGSQIVGRVSLREGLSPLLLPIRAFPDSSNH